MLGNPRGTGALGTAQTELEPQTAATGAHPQVLHLLLLEMKWVHCHSTNTNNNKVLLYQPFLDIK